MKVLIACEESQTVSKSTVAAILHRKIYVNSPGIAKAMAEQWGDEKGE